MVRHGASGVVDAETRTGRGDHHGEGKLRGRGAAVQVIWDLLLHVVCVSHRGEGDGVAQLSCLDRVTESLLGRDPVAQLSSGQVLGVWHLANQRAQLRPVTPGRLRQRIQHGVEHVPIATLATDSLPVHRLCGVTSADPSSAFSDLERPPLDARALRRALQVGQPGSWWRDLTVVGSTGSTNADLAAAARTGEAGQPGGAAVLVAEHQLTGRGRLNRSWQAPFRSALTVSVLVHPQAPMARWPWLPLLSGVAVAEAVRRAAGVDATLKWPNDVLVEDRKLAGVLVERVETPVGPAAVLGIGLNVSATRAELPVVAATSLALEQASTVDRQTILLRLLRTLEALHAAWTDAPDKLQDSYVRRCSTLGRQVRVELPDGSAVVGLAESVDTSGRLVVATSVGRRTLAVGDVRHVRATQ